MDPANFDINDYNLVNFFDSPKPQDPEFPELPSLDLSSIVVEGSKQGANIANPRRIGEIILSRRNELGMSQKALAKEIGTTVRTVFNWEKGYCKPGDEHVKKLVKALQLQEGGFLPGICDSQMALPEAQDTQGRISDKDQKILVGLTIKTRREELGLSKIKLAKKVGVTSVLSWERGISLPRGEYRQKLAPALGLQEDDFIPDQSEKPTDFSSHFKKLRKERGLTYSSLASKVGISETAVRDSEYGLYTTTVIEKIAKAYNLPLAELLSQRLLPQNQNPSQEAITTPREMQQAADLISCPPEKSPHSSPHAQDKTSDAPAAHLLEAEGVEVEIEEIGDDNDIPFGQIILSHREALGLNQKDVANAVGTTVRTVFNWETGYCVPGDENLKKVIQVLRLNEDVSALTATLPQTRSKPSDASADAGVVERDEIDNYKKMPIGQLIHNRRVQLGLNKRELANAIGVLAKTISNWERGSSKPRDIKNLAQGLRLSESVLTSAMTLSETQKTSQEVPVVHDPELKEFIDAIESFFAS